MTRLYENFAAAIEDERERLVLFIPAAFGAGCAVYLGLRAEPPIWAAIAGFAVSACGAVAARRRLILCFAFSLAAAFCAGTTWTQGAAARAEAPVLGSGLDPCLIEGRILEIIPLERGGVRLILAPDRLDPLPESGRPRRIRINFRSLADVFEPGDLISLKAGLMPPPAPLAPGGFEIARNLWFQGIGAVGFAYGGPRLISKHPSEGTVLNRWRHRIASRIQQVLPGATGGVANAILTGTKGNIPAEAAQALRDVGLAHLLVVAGMHMGFVAGFVFLIVRGGLALAPGIAMRRPTKKWAAAATIGVCFIYLLLTGAAPPTQRAFTMILMAMSALLLDRRAFSMRMLALAAMMVLLIAPEAVSGPSFQMSFAAVGCLIAAHESGWLREETRGDFGLKSALRHLGAIAAATVIAAAATEPFAAYHFNHVALYSLPANLFAVPITAFWSMPLGLLALLAMPLGCDAPLLRAMGVGIDAVLWAARTLVSLPGAIRHVPAMPVAAIALFGAGLVWVCLWQGRWRWYGLAPIAACFGLAVLAPRPDLYLDASGTTLAIRGTDRDLHFAPGRVKLASAESWLERDGSSIDGQVKRAGPGDRLFCGPEICEWRPSEARSILWSRHGDPVLTIQVTAHVVIVNKTDLARRGALSLRFLDDSVTMDRSIDLKRDRPWARSIVAADQTDQTALNLDAIGSENTRLVSGIGGLERD